MADMHGVITSPRPGHHGQQRRPRGRGPRGPGVDLEGGEQLVQVIRKGTGAQQWLPASAEAFVWIRLYLADLGDPLDPNEPLWWTLRRRDRGGGLRRQPLNYDVLRAVFRRVPSCWACTAAARRTGSLDSNAGCCHFGDGNRPALRR